MFEVQYEAQVRLLLECLPHVNNSEAFALHGGTAINLFVRDMPRLSVDIDLTYLPVASREESLGGIGKELLLLEDELKGSIPNVDLKRYFIKEGNISKLYVSTRDALVKIEPNLIKRGTLLPPELLDLCPRAQDTYEMYTEVRTVALPELYAGKICAALDRQHPRDFYDVKILMENEGITEDIRKAFIVYLAGHNRPMHELLAPNKVDIADAFKNQFSGMTREDVSLEDLVGIQERLPEIIGASLDGDDKDFLLSLKRGEPEWELLRWPEAAELPAIKWKLINIGRIDSGKSAEQLTTLERVLDRF
jgi:predicted nucleotidyltransferase component of viral defense system